MSSHGQFDTGTIAPVESATRLLQDRWPSVTALTPASIGLADDHDSTREFLKIVQSLSDDGFLTYEALVVDADGALVIDAALTARGREALAARRKGAN
ncbi:hypothetical protein ACX40Y_08795 [Sphingomonas sp. RS6]